MRKNNLFFFILLYLIIWVLPVCAKELQIDSIEVKTIGSNNTLLLYLTGDSVFSIDYIEVYKLKKEITNSDIEKKYRKLLKPDIYQDENNTSWISVIDTTDEKLYFKLSDQIYHINSNEVIIEKDKIKVLFPDTALDNKIRIIKLSYLKQVNTKAQWTDYYVFYCSKIKNGGLSKLKILLPKININDLCIISFLTIMTLMVCFLIYFSLRVFHPERKKGFVFVSIILFILFFTCYWLVYKKMMIKLSWWYFLVIFAELLVIIVLLYFAIVAIRKPTLGFFEKDTFSLFPSLNSYINFCVDAFPMIGFVGTVLGIILSAELIKSNNGELLGTLGIALMTTLYGLIYGLIANLIDKQLDYLGTRYSCIHNILEGKSETH